MISGLVFDNGFNSWLGSVKRMVLAELARKDDILVVHPGGLCVQARETQVSGSWELVVSGQLARQVSGHLARGSWWNGICTDCELCAVGHVMAPEKRRSLAHAVLQWRQL